MHTIEWVFSGIGVLVVSWIGFLICSRSNRSVRTAPTGPTSATPISLAASTTALLHENRKASLDYWINATVRIRKGDYYSVGDDFRAMRISVTDIRAASIPDKWGDIRKDQLAVELEIDFGGGVVYGGASTVGVGVNKYLLPRMEHEESPESIYMFHTRDDHSVFLRICVTHINAHDACADVNVVRASISLR